VSPKGTKRAMRANTVAAGTEGFQSAAMPPPFPPIDGYAFLSDCHTGALVAPDGAVGWLCVPRFDAGNFPQAFSHLALIEAAGRTILAERIQERQG
jgi:GH15 family glucan-1,4-alpha-glucosidase